jgi:hypothetical protein
MLNFFKKPTDNTIDANTTSPENLIRELKKEATQLKKTNYQTASERLKEALEIAKTNGIFEPIETELRYAAYLFEAQKRDEAFNQISKLMQYGSTFDPPKPRTSHWYSEQQKCLSTRTSFLAKEGKTESWIQYIFDSALSTHYDAMSYVLSRQEHIKTQGEFISKGLIDGLSRNLEFTLRVSEPEDIEKFGWKGFIQLHLTHLRDEYMSVLMEYSKLSDSPDFNVIESWLETNLKNIPKQNL